MFIRSECSESSRVVPAGARRAGREDAFPARLILLQIGGRICFFGKAKNPWHRHMIKQENPRNPCQHLHGGEGGGI